MGNMIRSLQRKVKISDPSSKHMNRKERKTLYQKAVKARVDAFKFISNIWNLAKSLGLPVDIDPKKLDSTLAEDVNESQNVSGQSMLVTLPNDSVAIGGSKPKPSEFLNSVLA